MLQVSRLNSDHQIPDPEQNAAPAVASHCPMTIMRSTFSFPGRRSLQGWGKPGKAWQRLWCGLMPVILLASLAATPEVERHQTEILAQTTSSWDGKELPEYPRGQPEVTVLRIIIPPKAELPMHKHLVINAGVLLKGKLTVVAEDGRSLHLKAGDSIVELVIQWHYGRNDGNEPAEIVVFYAGTHSQPITVTKSAP